MVSPIFPTPFQKIRPKVLVNSFLEGGVTAQAWWQWTVQPWCLGLAALVGGGHCSLPALACRPSGANGRTPMLAWHFSVGGAVGARPQRHSMGQRPGNSVRCLPLNAEAPRATPHHRR